MTSPVFTYMGAAKWQCIEPMTERTSEVQRAKKRALVTGATGFIGRHIAARLSRDYEVTTAGRSEGNDIQVTLPAELHLPRSPFDLVVHAAGTRSRESARAVNAEGTRRLADALEGAPPAAMVFISSCSVYGLREGIMVGEDTPLQPSSEYGVSKAEAEGELARRCASWGCPLLTLRPATVVGTGMTGSIMKLARAIDSGTYMQLPGHNAMRSYVHVTDVAEVVARLAGTNGVYNVTDGVPHSLEDITEALAARLRHKRIFKVPASVVTAARFAARMAPPLRRLMENLSLDLTFDGSRVAAAMGGHQFVDVVERLRRLAAEEDYS